MISPIFDVDAGRGVRVTKGRAERCFTAGFLGALCFEMDGLYDQFAASMSCYFYGQAPQLRPHRVWQGGGWVG